MTELSKNIHSMPNKSIEKQDHQHQRLRKKVLRLNALACNDISKADFDIENAMNRSQNDIKALEVTGGLQEMIAAQIISIHRLQQVSMSFANASDEMNSKQYFTNAAIKLANCFTQQANLLSRLQGNGGQRITIERVDVHHGGQAVVGSINGGMPTHKDKK